ncbi:MAG: hypothetical protein AMJ79_11865 [Phycisphaerae bacterium SM23_30]|nr:MAG: hypothetical protein AMJ79_11865 [Phycisphaerae bacterium SM23_30]
MNDREILHWDKRLKDQANRGWDNYLRRRINLDEAREDVFWSLAGEYIYVEEVSASTAAASIRINRKSNDQINLELGTTIKTVFTQLFISNTAQADQWIDIIIGINFEYLRLMAAGGGGGGGGTIVKNWLAEQTIINAVGVTVGTWSVDVDLETNGCEGAHVTIDADFPPGPTDNLVVEVRASLDATNYDDTPLYIFEIDNAIDPNQVSMVIKDVAHFKLYCYRSGVTDTITVTAKCQRWNYQSV